MDVYGKGRADIDDGTGEERSEEAASALCSIAWHEDDASEWKSGRARSTISSCVYYYW